MDKYYAIESQKSDFCRVSDVLLKQPIGVTLTVEQRNNLTAHIISTPTILGNYGQTPQFCHRSYTPPTKPYPDYYHIP